MLLHEHFPMQKLEQATSGFKEALGRGAFGTVFKGILAEGQKVVAVKRLDKELVEGETEFQTEIKIIGRTHHRNLVRLLGYCLDRSRRLLVYEYMTNGSLVDILFTPEKQPTWEERRKCVDMSLDENEAILEYWVYNCFDAGELDKLVRDEEVDRRQF
ncbi:calcium/calmodulin-regulated receptor-like kinase 2 [Solanum verrucosum]|uniref:calcium/calmodulin-regulated receptor-like kinase 2 n=1 Tax=Solanum verrucosum TaxID=315347 RepID=UPI0020D16EA5|nr:calcium/calmodulin-regulated receptor-like kinase 2 [Solanum verrucosum]